MFKTLQTRLLAWLVIPLLFISLAHLATSYIDVKNTSQKIFDKLLVTLAISISEHALSSGGDLLTDDILELIRVTTNDNLYYKVVGPDAAFVTGYEDIPEPPGGIQVLESNLQFYDAVYLDQPVRIITVSILVDNTDYSGWMTTFVAQTLRDRDEYVKSFLIDDIYRIILMIIFSSALLSFGVFLALKPIKKLQASVNRRSSHDLSPITNEHLPEEISGLVDEVNSLLYRLTSHLTLTKRFIENAAHELRTPVTALLPQTELALREATTEQEKNNIEKITKSAKKIARLTQQLLSLTNAESIALRKKDFFRVDLSNIASNSIDAIEKVNTEIEFSQKLLQAPVYGMQLLLDEVISNLIDNAIKYSNGAKNIQINSYVKSSEAILEVIDQGLGIPIEFREKVIERFFRLSRQSHGSGLGLAIVNEIVITHGGRLEITDGKDKVGTCIRCYFPLADNSM